MSENLAPAGPRLVPPRAGDTAAAEREAFVAVIDTLDAKLSSAREALRQAGRCPWCFAQLRDFVPPAADDYGAIRALMRDQRDPRTGHAFTCDHRDLRL